MKFESIFLIYQNIESVLSEIYNYFYGTVFDWSGSNDGNVIDMVFNKNSSDTCKQWISECNEDTCADYSNGSLSYTDFINKKLVLFYLHVNKISIPSIMDGLNPCQRKVLFGCFLKNDLKSQVKVSQLSGYIIEKSAYLEGNFSSDATIIGMAQNFVGSNNISLLQPNGQFGTRLCGGKDSASSRYIFTKLSPITRLIFPKVDDSLLKYLDDDGVSIEPSWYAPILPMVLVNGARGVGSGWSTDVPCYNPRDLVKVISQMLDLEDCGAVSFSSIDFEAQLQPWYRGFTGEISRRSNGDGFRFSGVFKEDEISLTVTISELPIGSWTQTYKDFLEGLVANGVLKEYMNYSTDLVVKFILEFSDAAKYKEFKSEGFSRKLNLSTCFSTSNLVFSKHLVCSINYLGTF